eukprot:TRINITY_DN36806_c0_g1_i1.p1 TRINITY_DN36806_c0_g1~~TRINITY_DN36806_c0_g1_i1.p1  ORF type:complete len:144 (+),score=15.31 TRINITY_DN36806_c0_g1_i1:60-434(+)
MKAVLALVALSIFLFLSLSCQGCSSESTIEDVELTPSESQVEGPCTVDLMEKMSRDCKQPALKEAEITQENVCNQYKNRYECEKRSPCYYKPPEEMPTAALENYQTEKEFCLLQKGGSCSDLPC